MANAAKEKTPFGISGEQLRKPIRPELLKAFGIAENANQSELGLAVVVLQGGSLGDGRQWLIGAHSPLDSGKSISYGAVSIESDNNERISPEVALQVAEDWIRGSSTTKWVPGSVLQIPTGAEPYIIGGLLLVRANEVTPNKE